MTTASIFIMGQERQAGRGQDREWFSGQDPDLWLYRNRTVGLLRRYIRLSLAAGRLPSLLGRRIFQPSVTSYRMMSFEDSVIFVHDVERSLLQLDEFARELIVRIVLQEYSQEEAGNLLGCCRRTVGRRLPEALDQLSEIFLAVGLLTPIPSATEEACQANVAEAMDATHCGGSE